MDPWMLVVVAFGCGFPAVFVLCSYLVAKRALFELKAVRIVYLIVGAIFLAGSILLLPLLPQPRWSGLIPRLAVGVPLAALGLIFRVAPLVYFHKKRTVANLGSPSTLVTDGPYGVVRHPQYASGIVLLVGWFVIWGGLYSLAALPVIIGAIYFQARIEEKLLLEKQFGDAYRQYRQRAGMFFPRFRRFRGFLEP